MNKILVNWWSGWDLQTEVENYNAINNIFSSGEKDITKDIRRYYNQHYANTF